MIDTQTPVTGDEFFNRSEILERLLSTGRNYALIGLRKSGKTSILYEFEKRLKKPDTIPVHIYLLFSETERSFLTKYTAAVLYSFLEQIPGAESATIEPRENLNDLIVKTIERLPVLASDLIAVLNELDKKPDIGIASRIFDLPYLLSKHTGNTSIIILDEFQVVQNFNIDMIDLLRQKIQTQRGVYYVIAGSAIGMMQGILTSSASPLFGHFDILSVGSFDYNWSRCFVTTHLKRSKLVIGEKLLNFLIAASGGFPYYLAVLADRIIEYCHANSLKQVNQKSIIHAFDRDVFDTSGKIFVYFTDSLENTFQRRNIGFHIEILKAIASGSTKQSQIARYTTKIPQELSRPLRFLEQAGFVTRNGVEYFITDPMLEMWLSIAYPLQMELSFIKDGKRLDAFDRKIEEMITAYRRELGKGSESRVRELFRDFGGLELHHTKLPKFTEVEQRVIDGNEFDIVARYGEHYWIAEVKSENINATDVNRFVEKLDKIGYTIDSTLIVALAGIDTKALRIAEENKIRVWNRDDVNFLMKLCGKFPILL
ncbi:MAG: AAA family ATPase [Methanosarcinaceae archaeon]